MPGALVIASRESDKALVRRFVRHNDGEAFSILMQRYADMVYTTCRRVLGDDALAADAVQETFFHLVKNADRITGSLGTWLHRVATRRAIDLIRQNISRRNREENYALDSHKENSWAEVEPAVDEALEELPEDLRDILLLHFLQGQSTIQIAAAQRVSQPTISRRLSGGLELLRQKLRLKGIMAGTVPLQAVLLHSNLAAPEALRVSLGKIALAKAAGAHSFWLLAKSAPVKIAAAAAVVIVSSAVWWNSPVLTSTKTSAVAATPKPAPPSPQDAEKARAMKDAAFLQPVARNPVPQAAIARPLSAQVVPSRLPKASPMPLPGKKSSPDKQFPKGDEPTDQANNIVAVMTRNNRETGLTPKKSCIPPGICSTVLPNNGDATLNNQQRTASDDDQQLAFQPNINKGMNRGQFFRAENDLLYQTNLNDQLSALNTFPVNISRSSSPVRSSGRTLTLGKSRRSN